MTKNADLQHLSSSDIMSKPSRKNLANDDTKYLHWCLTDYIQLVSTLVQL